MRLAYLIPRKNQCVLEFSYMGLVSLLKSNGCIKSISAHIVFSDDEFDYDIGANHIHHKPNFAQTEEEHKKRVIVGCYSRAVMPDNSILYEFMPKWEIDKVKRMSDGSSSKFSAWNTWQDEMIKKSVIKRHFKMLISESPNLALQTTMQIENENNRLINDFNKPKANIMSAFDDVQDNQQTLFEEPTDVVDEKEKLFQELNDKMEKDLGIKDDSPENVIPEIKKDTKDKAKDLVQNGLDNLSEAEIEEGLDDVLNRQKAGYSGYAGLTTEEVEKKESDLFSGTNISKEAIDELYNEKDEDYGKKKG
jgi:recombinational DNA repair protein RecT